MQLEWDAAVHCDCVLMNLSAPVPGARGRRPLRFSFFLFLGGAAILTWPYYFKWIRLPFIIVSLNKESLSSQKR